MVTCCSLEGICTSLPLPANLDPDLDRLVYILRPTLIIYTQLHDIAVLQLMRPRLVASRTQPDMVQERPRAGLGILDHESAVHLDPYLRMRTRDDFALEGKFVGT
jgi:hypothetical protein